MGFKPTDEDDRLWAHIIKGAKRLWPEEKKKSVSAPPKPSAPPHRSPAPETIVTPAPMHKGSRHDPPQLDRRTEERLKRGKLPIEGRIDLHGLTQIEAEMHLRHFISSAQAQGKRCVLVITGKGKISEPAVMKQRLPEWLSTPPLKDIVLKYVTAQPQDGGSGAWYVYLRRDRGF
jgi:DNA-nicking Smr family endonuclease